MDNTAFDYFTSESTMSMVKQEQSEPIQQSENIGTENENSTDSSNTDSKKNLNTLIPTKRVKRNKVVPTQDLQREDIRQTWSGVVTNIDEQNIEARLTDLKNLANPDELVTLSIDEIAGVDKDILSIGAQFYWYIGYREGFKKSKERFSIINFRRLPNWSIGDLNIAKSITNDYMGFFNGNN